MKRKYGHKKDPPTSRLIGGSGLRKMTQSYPAYDFKMLPLVGDIYDQGQTGSCVAQSAARCMALLLAQDGVFSIPSRRAIYAMGRVRGGQDAFSLFDDGTIPSAAVAAMHDWGVCLEQDWPWSEKDVDAALPWDVIQRSAAFHVTGWQKLDMTLDAIKIAVSSGYPVMFAMPVDDAYENYSGGVYAGRTGPELGGHMQTIVAYDHDVFTVCNSWGPEWGEGGMSQIQGSFLVGGECSDYYALEAVPKVAK